MEENAECDFELRELISSSVIDHVRTLCSDALKTVSDITNYILF